MDRTAFQIFVPDQKKFQITQNMIVLGLWGLTILILWVFDNDIPPNSDSRVWLLVIVGLISMGFLVVSHSQFRPLNGRISGEIVFDKDKIVVNDEVFELKSITKVDFGFGDYYGEHSLLGRDFNPKLYQGVSNSVSFIDSANQTHEISFKLIGKNQYKSLYPFINDAVQAGAMSYIRAIDLIDIENVTKPSR